jgi:hypothetical protein
LKVIRLILTHRYARLVVEVWEILFYAIRGQCAVN